MSLKKTILKIILFNVLVSLPMQSWAAVQLIAGVGQPAEDFPQGFIYKDIGAGEVIGSSGHIAFAGIADTNDGSTGNRSNAIWSGLPGQLKVVIKENESPEGLPENVLFGTLGSLRGATSSSAANMIVNRSGDVALIAAMKGAATGETLLLHMNGGNTSSVLMSGTQAPGFPPGVTLLSINEFKLSDAGMVILAQVIGGSSSGNVIWFYDFEKLTLLPSPAPDCNYVASSTINDSGEIVLGALLDGSSCANKGNSGIFKWRNSQWDTLVIGGQPVPNMADTVFALPSVGILGHSANDQGEIAFSASIINSSSFAQEQGIWVIDESDDPKPLVLGGEALANNSGDIIAPLINPFALFGFSNESFSITTALTPTGESVLLAGKPRNNQPYTSPDNITGTSQLAVLAKKNQRPPGFESNWFYLAAGESFALNRSGQFIFSGTVSDATTGNRTIALWRADKDNTSPRLKAMGEMKVTVNGKEHVVGINSLSFLDSSMTIGGQASRFSDNGNFLFDGTLSGTEALFLLLDDNKEQNVFTLAEQIYPQFFSPANVEDRLIEGFEYRFYPETNTYIGIKDNDVFVLGDVFGLGPQRIGTVDETLQFLEAR